MKMKKVRMLALVALMLATLCLTAYADNSSTVSLEPIKLNQTALKAVKAEFIQAETKVITGTVKEINDYCIVVAAEDGKTYAVPIAVFADTEEFKSMELKVNDSITVEGPDFSKLQVGQSQSVAIARANGTVTVGSGAVNIQPIEVKDANIIEGKNFVFSGVAPTEIKLENINFGKMEVNMVEGVAIISREMKEDSKEFVIKEADKVISFKLDKDAIIFSAEKITAKGVTISLRDIMPRLMEPVTIQYQPMN
jgi:hypothetical protein